MERCNIETGGAPFTEAVHQCDRCMFDERSIVPVVMIHTFSFQVDSGVYLPMVKSMSALKKLQLALARPCGNDTVRDLLDQFPRCNVVRLRRSKALFLSTPA